MGIQRSFSGGGGYISDIYDPKKPETPKNTLKNYQFTHKTPGVNFMKARTLAFFWHENTKNFVLAYKTPVFGKKYRATWRQFKHFCFPF